MSNVNNEGVLTYLASVGAGNGLNAGGGSRTSSSSSSSNSWFEAMSRAWGQRLDAQASRITQMSDAIGSNGDDQPSNIVKLTAESLRMQFLSQNAATSQNSTGEALNTLGRKQ